MRRAAPSAVLLCGLLLVALNLRAPVAAVGPVLGRIEGDLGLSPAASGALTAIPVLAFGCFAFAGPALIERFGLHRTVAIALGALVVGALVRLPQQVGVLFAGTVLVGVAIAVANVAMPAVVKHDFPGGGASMLGLYSTALSLSSALGAGLAVPLADLGGGWSAGLALWTVPVLVALAAWLPQLRRDGGSAATSEMPPARPSSRLLRDPTAWAVTAFMGLQSLGFYATLTWAPTLLVDAGLSESDAGWLVAWANVPAVVGSLAAPTLARRWRPEGAVVLAASLIAIAYLGLALSPTQPAVVWLAALGLGQGASLALALSLIVWRSPDPQRTGRLSAMAQGVGYLLAALGPLGLGPLHDRSGGWTLPLAVLGVVLAGNVVAGLRASRAPAVGTVARAMDNDARTGSSRRRWR